MNPEDEEKLIRRIMVAIDASPPSLAALQAAADLARLLEAELQGIYVEDINLLRISELPFARRLGVYSASPLPLDRGNIEQEMRAHANIARRALVSLAGRMHLQSSFRVARGVIAAELLQASSEADLVILGKTGWSRRKRLGSTTRILVAQSPSHTMILSQTAPGWGRPHALLGVIFDGSEASQRSLKTAAHLMRGRTGALTVIILATDIDTAGRLQGQASEQLKPAELDVHYRWLVGLERSRLPSLARSEGFAALVLPASGILSSEALETFLDDTDIPVLLVR